MDETERVLTYKSVNVRFVVDKVALGQVSLEYLLFSPVSTLPLTCHIYSFIFTDLL